MIKRFLVNDVLQMDFYRRLDKMIISFSFSLQSIDPQNIFFSPLNTHFCVRELVVYLSIYFSENCTEMDNLKKISYFNVTNNFFISG